MGKFELSYDDLLIRSLSPIDAKVCARMQCMVRYEVYLCADQVEWITPITCYSYLGHGCNLLSVVMYTRVCVCVKALLALM